jgi:rare lipoprotein A
MNMTRNLKSVALAIAGVILLPSCVSTVKANPKTLTSSDTTTVSAAPKPAYAVKSTQLGKASWYSIKTNYGTQTASGQRLRNDARTAAHKTLPLGTKVRVTNQSNGKSEILTINDRGPYVKGRIIDVTVGSAERLGFVSNGIASVKVEVLGKDASGV